MDDDTTFPRRQLLLGALGAAGLAAAPGLRAQARGELLLGQSAVLSGPLGKTITALNQGMQLALDQANATGGVHGQSLKLISLDDELKPDKAVANYKALAGDHRVSAFLGCVGSGTTAAAAETLRETGLPSFGGYAVGDGARAKAKGSAYFVRATYGREAEVLVNHLLTLGIDKIAVAHLDNPGGEEVVRSITRLLEARQHQLRGVGAVANDGANVGQVGRTLAAQAPQAIIMFLNAPLAAGLMDAVTQTGHRPGFYGMSIVAGDAVASILGPEKARSSPRRCPTPGRRSSRPPRTTGACAPGSRSSPTTRASRATSTRRSSSASCAARRTRRRPTCMRPSGPRARASRA